ncbi:MAG: pirin family protein [Acidobacteriota bacterium]|nr:pirin family protein [Acidobacteriota bacterium]
MASNEVEVIITAREESIGAFSVRRTLPSVRRRMVGPFTFLDHMGPVSGSGSGLDVLPHPHIGLATLTYLFEGEVVHRDTLGNTQRIRPREVNWMVAGRGIAHSERSPFESKRMHGIQAWIALPEEHEEDPPEFTHLDEPDLPLLTDTGVDAQLLSGSAYGLTNRARSFSPHFYVAARVEDGARIALPQEHQERAIYVATGAVTFANERYTAGQLIVAAPQSEAVLTSDGPSQVMLLGGEPLGRRFMWWNFVSSRKERIEQAKEDWRSGRIALPPDDDREFVPLPPDLRPRKPEPEPMS